MENFYIETTSWCQTSIPILDMFFEELKRQIEREFGNVLELLEMKYLWVFISGLVLYIWWANQMWVMGTI